MSNKEPKVYLNKFNAVKSSEYGFSVYIKSVDELYQELKSHANADGSIRMYVSKKMTPDKFGNDGNVTLNTWKPTPGGAPQPQATQPAAQPAAQVYAPAVPQGAPVVDDLPF
jgi:hypothetical protein